MNKNATRHSLPSIGALLHESWERYKARYKVYTGILLRGLVILIIGMICISGAWLLEGLIFDFHAPLMTIVIVDFFAILYLILFAVLSTWIQLALIYAVIYHKESVGVKEAYQKTWKRINSYWWIQSLSLTMILFGFLFFIVPGLVLLVWFIFDAYILLSEKQKGLPTLMKSREYVRGLFWPISTRVLAIFSLLLLITGGSVWVGSMNKELSVIVNILVFLLLLVLIPFYAIYCNILFEKVKTVKAGLEFHPTKKQKQFYTILLTLGVVAVVACMVYWLYLVTQSPILVPPGIMYTP